MADADWRKAPPTVEEVQTCKWWWRRRRGMAEEALLLHAGPGKGVHWRDGWGEWHLLEEDGGDWAPCRPPGAPPLDLAPLLDAEAVARLFHETYERLAPSFGYETRKASAKPWPEVPENNRNLMIAVAGEVLRALRAAGIEVPT